jgi:hypothetical protein
MLTTRFDGGLRGRPLQPSPDGDEALFWFVTDLRSGKEHEIEAEQDVCLIFINPEEKAYLSTNGRAKCAATLQSSGRRIFAHPGDEAQRIAANIAKLRELLKRPDSAGSLRARLL